MVKGKMSENNAIRSIEETGNGIFRSTIRDVTSFYTSAIPGRWLRDHWLWCTDCGDVSPPPTGEVQ